MKDRVNKDVEKRPDGLDAVRPEVKAGKTSGRRIDRSVFGNITTDEVETSEANNEEMDFSFALA